MSAAQPAQRKVLYDRLGRHNRRIGFLRVGVPVLGCALLVFPVAQIGLSTLAETVSIGGVRLEADTLVIDSPRFEGRTATGTVYAMTAERAESRIGNLDVADLFGLHIDLEGGPTYRAEIGFTRAEWTMTTEQLTSNEDVFVTDSTGASGVLGGVQVDWPAQVITSEGPVAFDFDDGAQLRAATMVHDMAAATWQFGSVSLDMVPAPDAGAPRNPHEEEHP